MDLWDWRTRIADLYAEIRRMPDAQAAWRLWRATRDELFAHHPQTALEPDAQAAFTVLDLYPYDPALRLLVRLRPATGPSLHLPAGDDGAVAAQPFARTDGLSPLGGELTLYWLAGYGGGVFLPFTDATSGTETYGGGRYLLDTIKGADLGHAPDGRAILDFNFAYSPSCAHSPRFVCPLAPRSNHLAAAIRGGEKYSGAGQS
jgi:uncharacterized protein (DUF1684 family)